jgi:hypothetical protein
MQQPNIKIPQKIEVPTQVPLAPIFQPNNMYSSPITNFIPSRPVSPIPYIYQNNINMPLINQNIKPNIPQTLMKPMQPQIFRNPSI